MVIIVIRKAICFGVEGIFSPFSFCLPIPPHPASSFKNQCECKAQGHGKTQWS